MLSLIDYMLDHPLVKLCIALLALFGGLVASLRFFWNIDSAQDLRAKITLHWRAFKRRMVVAGRRGAAVLALRLLLLKSTLLTICTVALMVGIAYTAVRQVTQPLAKRNTVWIGALTLPADWAGSPFDATCAIDEALKEANETRGPFDKRVDALALTVAGALGGYDAATAVRSMLSSNQIAAIVNASTSSTAMAIAPLLADEGVVQVTAIPSSPMIADLPGLTVRVGPTDDVELRGLGAFAAEALDSIVVVYGRQTRPLADAFSDEFRRRRGETVTSLELRGRRGVDSLLNSLDGHSPDGLAVIIQDDDALVSMLRHASERKWQVPIYIPSWHMETARDHAIATRVFFAEVDPWEVDSTEPGRRSFVKRFRTKCGRDPSKYDVYVMDSIGFLTRALRDHPTATGEELLAVMKEQGPYDGIIRTLEFSEDGSFSNLTAQVSEIEKGGNSPVAEVQIAQDTTMVTDVSPAVL